MAPDPFHPSAHGLTSRATRGGGHCLPPASLAAPACFPCPCFPSASATSEHPPRDEGRRPAPPCPHPVQSWHSCPLSVLQVHSPADAGLWHAHHRHPAPRHRAPLRQARDGALRPEHVSGKGWLRASAPQHPVHLSLLRGEDG